MLHTNVDRQNVPTVYLAGEMDLDCAETLRATVERGGARGPTEVVLDFAGVEFIDSSGTGIFVRLCLDLQAQGVTRARPQRARRRQRGLRDAQGTRSRRRSHVRVK